MPSTLPSNFDSKAFSAYIPRFIPVPPFRFLDLLPEMRCIVYEYLITMETERHTLDRTESGCTDEDWLYPSSIKNTFVRRSLPVTLLATCRLINQDAMPYFRPQLKELEKGQLQITLDPYAALAMVSAPSPLLGCFPDLPCTWTYKTRPNATAEAFIARCKPFITHTQQFRIADGQRHVNVEFTMIPPVPRSANLGPAVFEAMKETCVKFGVITAIFYEAPFMYIPQFNGISPNHPVVRAQGLGTLAWRQHLRVFQGSRKYSWLPVYKA